MLILQAVGVVILTGGLTLQQWGNNRNNSMACVFIKKFESMYIVYSAGHY